MSSPLDTAGELHRAWPTGRLVVLEDEGHGGAGMTEAWIDALDEFVASR